MIFMLTINVDLSSAIGRLDDLQKRQVPFAAKNALNKLAKQVIEAEQDEMKTVFDRPTNWTLNSLFVRQYAQKDNLTAIVDFKDGKKNRTAGKYLRAQIHGGGRRTKAVETFFIKHGLMPPEHHILPAANFPLDAHGNIPLSAFKAMVKAVAAGTHFVLLEKRGRLSAGLYHRLDERIETRTGATVVKQVRALIYYVHQSQYNKRMRHAETAQQTVERNQADVFKQELDYALRTAR